MREKVQVFVLRQLWDFEIYAETADHGKSGKQTLILQNPEVMGYEVCGEGLLLGFRGQQHWG